MNPILIWLAARLKEPTTYLGIPAMIAGFTHYQPSATMSENIVSIATVIGGALGTFLAEKGKA